MTAEIITIGNELLCGDIADTNSSFIGQRLSEIGMDVEWVTSLGDDESRIQQAFKNALRRVDLVVATGGLGPTHDDVTKKAFAELFQKKLVLNEKTLEKVKARFASRGLEMPEVNIEQAMVPEGVQVLENRSGTAPGFHLEQDGKHIFLLPGVPYEMKGMMDLEVIPILKNFTEGGKTLRLTLRTTGISESALFERLRDLKDKDCLAFLPRPSGVDVKITVRGENAEQRIQSIAEAIRQRAGEFIYGTGEGKLEEIIGKKLLAQGLKIAVAESCTGGLIADRLTNVPGSSTYFERGVVTYSNESKIQLLNVPRGTIERYGAVSAETAEAMASGIRDISGVDIGLSVTGIAGPTGATPNKPVGLAFIGLSTATGTFSKRFQFGTERLINKQRMAQAALEIVRRALV